METFFTTIRLVEVASQLEMVVLYIANVLRMSPHEFQTTLIIHLNGTRLNEMEVPSDGLDTNP